MFNELSVGVLSMALNCCCVVDVSKTVKQTKILEEDVVISAK